MLIEIQGEHSGSITMFGDAATKLLKMMGQSGQPSGALRSEDVANALSQLEQTLEKLDEPSVEDEDGNHTISLKTRARPLVDLLRTNAERQGYVMWAPK